MDAIATTAWTEEFEQEVIRQWLDKRSARQISDSFIARGFFVSRNAIMGKIHRLGLRRAKVTVLPPMPRSPTPYRAHVAPRKPKAPPQQRPQKKIVPAAIDIFPLRIAFADLDAGQCRFECTDAENVGDYLFCGLPTKDATSSFCDHHHARCWSKPNARPGTRPIPRAA